MNKFGRAWWLAALLLWPQATAFGWDDTGHMLVASIAYRRLHPRAQGRVDQLVKTIRFCGKTYDGITIGVWMDDIKADSTHDDLREWHYINLPHFDGLPADPAIKAADNNVVSRIRWAVEMLKKGTGSERKDAEILGYIAHLVGDIHQPLHATTRYTPHNLDGDAGGNEFKITGLSEATNLHWYWDAAAGSFDFWQAPRPLDEATRRRLNNYASALTTAHPAHHFAGWQESDPAKWADESHSLARTVAYRLAENSTPGRDYKMSAQAVAKQRIALAGYRLAQVLNRIYPETQAQPPRSSTLTRGAS